MVNTHDLKNTKTPLANFRLKPLTAYVRLLMAGGTFAIFSPAYAELPIPSANWVSPGGVATHETVGNALNIKQETDRVILNWEKFNVSSDSAVNYKQPASTSIALNRIGGKDPSNIMGSISANGQIYLVNKNGFVFGKDSVVNTQGLVASTLDISDQVFKDGITKVAGIDERPAFEGNGDFYRQDTTSQKKEPIAIKVDAGARIKANEGQRILIIAPTIENNGNIEAPGGQVMLAAATDKVFLQEASQESDVRGLLVEVKTGGDVKNLAQGKIASERGNVTLMGFAVNQHGKISATTTTNVNGTIRLLAREGVQTQRNSSGIVELQGTSTTRSIDTGDGLGQSSKVILHEDSKTEVQPQKEFVDAKETTAIDSQSQPLSRVEVLAKKVHLKGGSEITAQAGKIEVTATENPLLPVSKNTNKNDSRILIDSGAKIDVSGIDSVVKPMESNIVELELRTFELKDAPLQKNGILKNKTILVDVRKGTPIADIKPIVDGIKRTLDERLTNAGSINLNSEGDLISEDNSILDFSGGAVTYLDGLITTTKLSSNGRIIDISEADPLLTYDGIYGEVTKDYKKWGVTKIWKIDAPFALAQREVGYVEGKQAGTLSIKGANIVLEGDLLGQAISGIKQRNVSTQAKGGELIVDNGFSNTLDQAIIFTKLTTGLNLSFDEALPENYLHDLVIQPDFIFNSGIQTATLKSNNTIEIANNTVKLLDNGKLILNGGAIDINSNIEGHGATVDLTTSQAPLALDGHINVNDGVRINLQGEWVNDFASQENLTGKRLSINGGTFKAKSDGDINIKKGSLIDVSGGAWVQVNSELKAGNSGIISLSAIPENNNKGANILLGGLLYGFGLGDGGTFATEANSIAIRRQRKDEFDGVTPLQITTDLFDTSGFAKYSFTSNLNGLTVEEGAVINLVQKNRLLNRDYLTKTNAEGIGQISQVVLLSPEIRAPSKISFNANHSAGETSNSNLVFEKNAKINADDLSSISLESDTSLIVDGEINTHGGEILLKTTPSKANLNDPRYVSTQGIWLGDTAKLDVSGVSHIVVDALGRSLGKVFKGGNVNIQADRGFFASLPESFINVSGTSAIIHLPQKTSSRFGVSYQPITIGSNAGEINIAAAEGVFIAGQMLAKPGDPLSAAGGKLSIKMDIDKRNDPDVEIGSTFPGNPRKIIVSQKELSILSQDFKEAGNALPNALNGLAFISSEDINTGRFSSLALTVQGKSDEIQFQGDLSLQLSNSIMLNAPKFGWERLADSDVGRVDINATSAQMGSMSFKAASENPTDGLGEFTINADLIDLVGGSVTTGFNKVNLIAQDDIRLQGILIGSTETDFSGEFKTYSKLTMAANQIYPTTLSQFSLAVLGDPSGTAKFSSTGNNKPVLSALSKLKINAPNIEQSGTIKAPLGEIVFTANDSIKFGATSITSVSAEGQIIPLGITQGNLEWLFPLSGSSKSLVIEAPQKKISFTADQILTDDGALIDLSGGGDLLAYEFITGPGGSVDVLNSNHIFAVIPGLSNYAPIDPLEYPKSGLNIGDSIYIAAGSSLSAGEYTLLPARYALLPGAFLISPLDSSADIVPDSMRSRVDGSPIVSGYRKVAGTEFRDQFWSEFVVESGSIAKTRSEYNIDLASSFFGERAARKEQAIPRLPQDAGQLVIDAKFQLDLPIVRADVSNNALGGLVDIIADNLSIVTNKSVEPSQVELLADDIGKLQAGSLLLGAIRSTDNNTGNTRIDIKAKTVTIAENTFVKAPEILLAATDKVELKNGARLQADGKALDSAGSNVLEITGDGALLRTSTASQAVIKRTNTQGIKGDLIVGKGALISVGSGSVTMDSTSIAKMDGELELTNGALTIGADSINIGEVDGVTVNGLSFDNNQLSRFAAQELVLNSRSAINIFGQLVKTDINGNPELDVDGKFKPIEFGNLVIDSSGISGHQNDGKTAFFKAKKLTLTNKSGAIDSLGSGSASLFVDAEQLVLDTGSYKLSGFNEINFNLKDALLGRTESKLTALGNLTFKTPLVSAESGAATTINAVGYSLIADQEAEGVNSLVSKGLGGSLKLIADSVRLNTIVAYQAGNVNLTALEGDVALNSDAVIDVSGAVVNAGLSKPVNLAAGKITLNSQKKNIVTDIGSNLFLKATNPNMSAGFLTVNAGQGQALLNGFVDAQGNGSRVALDIGSLPINGFNSLNTLFRDAGFSGGIDLRLRNGDIIVASDQRVTANSIKLTADSGKISLAGTLDASSNEQGGTISLSAEDQLSLESTAQLLAMANGDNGAGGKVKLASIESEFDGAGIELKNGSRVSVLASGNGVEGEVQIRADRVDLDGDTVEDEINVKTILPGAILGDSSILVEAVKIYNDESVDVVDQDSIRAGTQDYMERLIQNNVANSRFGNGFQIQPGVEISSAGDLAITSAWNFVNWRYGKDNAPGILTLRAAGNVLLQQNLTDAFAPGQIDLDTFGVANIDNFLQSGQSWSYNIVAGADLSSAGIDNTGPMAADINLSDNVVIRTGTGDVAFYTSSDIVYGNNSVIYTAGRPDENNRWGFSPVLAGGIFYAEYPLEGGDITLTAGRDIIGKYTNQLTSGWLVRTGNWSRNETHSGERPTAWGIAFGSNDFTGLTFQHLQSLAALGGGNIKVMAGGNISDLSVVIPTTGKQIGEASPSEDVSNFDYITNKVQVNGGGSLHLTTDGDILGGVFHVDGGKANLFAGGSIKAGSNKDANNVGLSPILAMGDSQINITAKNDIALEAVIDPMIVPQLQLADAGGIENVFFRYNENSTLALTSLSGGVTLENDVEAIDQATDANISNANNTDDSLKIYPGTLKVNALGGDIRFERSQNLFPSRVGDLELYARKNIVGNAIVNLSDADPQLLPSFENPSASFLDTGLRMDPFQPANFSHALIPLHAQDNKPVVISTGEGSIGVSNLSFILSKHALVNSGNDLRNVNFKVQHNYAAANTVLKANRDIKFDIPINIQTGEISDVDQRIEIAGPGQLTILAGRNIDLGSSAGILTIGDQLNPALDDEGANITALAGLAGGGIDITGFAEKFLPNYPLEHQGYLERITSEIRNFTTDPSLDTQAALVIYNNLSVSERSEIEGTLFDTVEDVFFKELNRVSKKLANAKFKQEQDLSELQLLATIETLFPGTTLLSGNEDYSVVSDNGVNSLKIKDHTSPGALLDAINNPNTVRPVLGDMSLIFSTIQTLDGGGINLLTPNGGINAGLSASFSGTKKVDKLGIIIQKEGDINVINRDNFAVNVARVMTLGGGSIMAGSTEGNIDAGRSPKTSLSAPAPKVTYDALGNAIIEFSPVLAGGGIRTISPPGSEAGDVLLFAPRGIIDAGEAGIAGNNVTVTATAIVGADNIDVGGVSVGVPVAATGSVAAGLTGVSNLAASVTNAVASSTNIGKDSSDSLAEKSALGMLMVDILGFGE
jgi:filamentous hemagglutinin